MAACTCKRALKPRWRSSGVRRLSLSGRSGAGLRGCGINTEKAAIGDTFQLAFHVFSRAMPAQHASYSKTIVVVDPCQPGETYCPDSDLKCDGTPCTLRRQLEAEGQLRPLAAPQLVVADTEGTQLLDTTLVLNTTCGDPLLFNLQPCVLGEDAAETRPCSLRVVTDERFAARPTVARTVFAGACDLASLLRGEDGACVTCTAADIQAGDCEPSTQYVRISATDPSGAATQALDFVVRVRAKRAQAPGQLAAIVAQPSNAADAIVAVQRTTSRALTALAADEAACAGSAVYFGSTVADVRSSVAASADAGSVPGLNMTATATISLASEEGDPAQQEQLLRCLDAVLSSPHALQSAAQAVQALETLAGEARVTQLAFQPANTATLSQCPSVAADDRMRAWAQAAVEQAAAHARVIAAELVRYHRLYRRGL